MSAHKPVRKPKTILADWLRGYVGDDKPQDAYLPYAEQIIGWLSDEGWRIVRDEPADNPYAGLPSSAPQPPYDGR